MLYFSPSLLKFCYGTALQRTSIVDCNQKLAHQALTGFSNEANLQAVRNPLRIMSDFIHRAGQDEWMSFVTWNPEDDPDWAGMLLHAITQTT